MYNFLRFMVAFMLLYLFYILLIWFFTVFELTLENFYEEQEFFNEYRERILEELKRK